VADDEEEVRGMGKEGEGAKKGGRGSLNRASGDTCQSFRGNMFSELCPI